MQRTATTLFRQSSLLRQAFVTQKFHYNQVRFFNAKIVGADFKEPLTVTELKHVGLANLSQTKEAGVDYEAVIESEKYGVKNDIKTFKSFEEEINAQFAVTPSEPAHRLSKRSGVVGYKIGMTNIWDKWGKLTPCTVVQLDRCQVTQVKTKEKDGVDAVQVGVGEKHVAKMKKPQIGHLLKHNLPPKAHFGEFQVTPENFLPIGYCLGPRHFQIGQFVDVQSVSKGKGFQGTIKKWNFASQENSHGNSKAHRLPGSIGHAEFPGKVFKGKKMAGRLGNNSATVLSQRVVKIDTDRALLYIQGNVPGAPTALVKVRDAVKKIEAQVWDLHYPTFLEEHADEKHRGKMQVYEGAKEDPLENDYHENDVVSGAIGDDE